VFHCSSHSLTLIQVLDAKLEAEQNDRSRKRAKNAKESNAAPKRQPKKAAAKSQKVQSNTSDTFLELQYLLPFTDKTIKIFKANLAGSDDEDFEPPNPKPAAQKKKPLPKKVGSLIKPFLTLRGIVYFCCFNKSM
jgi:hypothetical protein